MALLSHQRDANARRSTRTTRIPRAALVAAPIAVLATASAVTAGILLQGPAASSSAIAAGTARADPAAAETVGTTGTTGTTGTPAPASSEPPVGGAAPAPAAGPGAPLVDPRGDVVSRSSARMAGPVLVEEPGLMSEKATRRALRQATTQLWTTTELNLWSTPGLKAEEEGLLESSRQVLVTGREKWGRVEVVVGGRSQWVTDGYLSTEEPVATGAGAGLSMAPCPDGGVESGLTDRAVYVYRSVCNAFPEITTYGGYANRGSEHSTGGAIDIMVSDPQVGDAIASFLATHFDELGLTNIIWSQQILSSVGGGWRYMEDRGSATANHYDHVHVFAR